MRELSLSVGRLESTRASTKIDECSPTCLGRLKVCGLSKRFKEPTNIKHELFYMTTG